MQTVDQQDIKKRFNAMGLLYENASESKRLAFKAAITVFSERDKKNYWKSFIEVWRYKTALGSAPFAIVASAHNVLGFNYLNDAKNGK